MPNDSVEYVLIAASDPQWRGEMADILTNAGYHVIQALDGGSALKVVHEHKVIAVIVDHYMQPHGGLEFARDIAFDKYDIPMLLITGTETSDLLFETINAHFTGFLKRPVDPDRLVGAVQRMVRISHAPRNPDHSLDQE